MHEASVHLPAKGLQALEEWNVDQVLKKRQLMLFVIFPSQFLVGHFDEIHLEAEPWRLAALLRALLQHAATVLGDPQAPPRMLAAAQQYFDAFQKALEVRMTQLGWHHQHACVVLRLLFSQRPVQHVGRQPTWTLRSHWPQVVP